MYEKIQQIVEHYGGQKIHLLNIFWDIQTFYHWIPKEAIVCLSEVMDISIVELEDTLTFYHFFRSTPAGPLHIYVDRSALAEIYGASEVIQIFEEELGIKLGQYEKGSRFSLFETSCIGMTDQLPAALVGEIPVGNLNPDQVRAIAQNLKKGKHPEVDIKNYVRSLSSVFGKDKGKQDISKLLSQHRPEEVIACVTSSGLRGRGGAGFSTGKKWSLCQGQKDLVRYVVCNADEGEPGTFKDRYLLLERFDLVLEGMILGGYAIGAQEGIIYLRAEYRYMREALLSRIEIFRQRHLLGQNAGGVEGFHFDVRLQIGAGAYVVGEETALLESLEGKRGEPRLRPPFPVEQGFLGHPTIVNNVETFATIPMILSHGADWYHSMGTEYSKGTKLLSVGGDCQKPGIYEVEWGLDVGSLLEMVEAENPQAILVGGPSGEFVNPAQRDRQISLEDLSTGGSVMIFNQDRDLLEVVENFTNFFVSESCGCCAPCRAGSLLFSEQMVAIRAGQAAKEDLARMKSWAKMVTASSRCGLGQTCSRPVITSLESFPGVYQSKLLPHESKFRPFELDKKVLAYDEVTKTHG